MATINKKLIHFRSLSDFEARLAAGDVLSTSIVWIKDAKKIWTHGTYYDCSDGGSIAIDSTLSATSENAVQNKVITGELAAIANNKQDTISDLASIRSGASAGATAVQPDDLAAVATSGSYDDLTNKPTIPSGTITGVSANGTSVATSGVANIPAATTSKYGVTKLSSATNSTSTSLAATASAIKAAYDLANGKQDKLTSGTNIKTVNGQSLLGSGDITISGGGSYVPMNNTWYDSPEEVTITPNSSVEIVDLGLTSIAISLTEPTDNSVVNTYTLVIRKFGIGNAFTFDKTIYWANDNAPVFDTSESDEIVEISIKRSYEGIYLGTWTKYTYTV